MASGGFNTLNNESLIRTDLWEQQLKTVLVDDLNAMKWVRMITDFNDGVTLHIPSIGEASTSDFVEGQAIKYNKLDEGDFTFEHDQYKYSAHSISEKFKRDSFYSSSVISSFVPLQHRAILEGIETRILSRGPSAQTASDLNTINTGDHRFVASGTGQSISVNDLARAKYSLMKANIPLTNLVGCVDPSVTFTFETQANLVNALSPMPHWGDVNKNGLVTGMRFRYNILGWDIYESNYLPNGISETIDSVAVTNGVANQFFSAAGGDINPIIGSFRQMPKVYTEFNKDLQQTEYLTITEYGFALYRPENMVVILSDSTVVG